MSSARCRASYITEIGQVPNRDSPHSNCSESSTSKTRGHRWSRFCVLGVWSASLAGCAGLSPSIHRTNVTNETVTVATAVQHGITIQWVRHPSDTNRLAVEIEGLDSKALRALESAGLDQTQWTKFLGVYIDPKLAAAQNDLPPIQGRYEILENRVRFEPAFPVQLGLTYRVEVHLEELANTPSASAHPVIASFKLAAPPRVSKTVVRQVYPSSPKLPENLLKFYIHFSGPMSRGGIYEHIHLLHASGQAVELPFLELGEELWNPEMTRLTLFIDPGRIKRGVRPLEEFGPSMQAGKRYTLAIDQNWRDGDGVPLKASYRKAFQVGPPDRDPPNPNHWTIHAPKANTREPLVIRFPEPMEQALTQRLIWVIDTNQSRLAGDVALTDRERAWSLTPETIWKAGRYEIVVDTWLEDLAGNSVGRPFEVDVFERVDDRPSKETVTLPFEVRSR